MLRVKRCQLSVVQVKIGGVVAALAALPFLLLPANGRAGEDAAPATPVFTVGWSPNAGNNPYPYLESSGLLKKWADRYHLEIKLQRLDYKSAIDAFVSRKVDACVMSNLAALNVSATAGIDATVLYLNDSSNGNDVILARSGVELKDLPSKKTLLDQKSVSLYLLERAMTMQGLESQIPNLKLINTEEDGIARRFLKDQEVDVAVTWKPMASQIVIGAKAKDLFNSSQVPGEIVHFMAVRTELVNRPDGSGERFAKALTGAWYEVMAQLAAPVMQSEVLGGIASATKNTIETVNDQLDTTKFFMSPNSALRFENGSKDRMSEMRLFCFNHKLLGDAKSPEEVAIEYPDESIDGKRDHVRLRLDSKYMALALGRRL